MQENRKEYWDKVYKNKADWKPASPVWLEKYVHSINTSSNILDVGCGTGCTAEYLISHGHSVIAVDISDTALTRLKDKIPAIETRNLDFSLGLPWENESFNFVVADLSLHYFDLETTKRIITDIKRVLVKGGVLFARVNSVKDVAHGFGKGIEIERFFFSIGGHQKRFFDRDMITEVFSGLDLTNVTEDCIATRDGDKHLFEIACRKQT